MLHIQLITPSRFRHFALGSRTGAAPVRGCIRIRLLEERQSAGQFAAAAAFRAPRRVYIHAPCTHPAQQDVFTILLTACCYSCRAARGK